MPYFTLATRPDAASNWAPQFGDFSKKVVAEERANRIESGETTKRNSTIVSSAPDQASIDAAVAKLNAC